MFAPPTENVVKFPGVVSVTVTLAPLANAVVPTVALAVLQALIAAARFVARFVVLASVTKVPVVEPVHVLVPATPPLTALHEKMPALFVFPTARKGPGLV